MKLSEMSLEEATNKAFEVLAEGYSLEDLVEEHGENFGSNGSLWQEYMSEGTTETVDGWTATVVKKYGGEGKGDQYWMVVSVTDGETTRFFRMDGWYASYDGGYLDNGPFEVTPKEKVVVFYE